MDDLTLTRVFDGCEVDLLPSGEKSYQRRWQLLEQAQSSIHIVAFSIMRDETSRKLRDLICRKSEQGVACRVILDDAVLYSTFAANLLRDMRCAGAEVVRYHKVFRDIWPQVCLGHPFQQFADTIRIKLRRRFHEKYLVVDGKEAILGGVNWGNKYAYGGIRPKAWRDSDVYLAGPVVTAIQRQFIRDLFIYRAFDQEYKAKSKPEFCRQEHYAAAMAAEEEFVRRHREDLMPPLEISGAERIRYVPHKPYDEQLLRLTNAHLMLLRNAQEYIYWGCHGIRPPAVIAETLIDAVKRGVDVRLITNSKHASRTLMLRGLLGWMYYESSNHFRHLIENGVRIYEWQKPGAFHSKNLVIDDIVASIGSYNIARGSTFHHTESNVIVTDGNFPIKVREQFEIDFDDCREIPLMEVPHPNPKADPYLRPLHPRNKLIDATLLPDSVRRDLEANRVKSIRAEEERLCPPIDLSPSDS